MSITTKYNKSELADFAFEFNGAMKVINTPESAYRQDKGANQSFLKDILSVSPSYAWFRKNNPEQSPALTFGSALHCWVLEHEKFNSRYAVMAECDRRTTEGKAYYAQFVADSAGKTVLKSEDYDKILSMSAKAKQFFNGVCGTKSHHEVQFYASISVTSGRFKGEILQLKALFDAFYDDGDNAVIKDLKSVQDISNVVGASYNNGWAVQSAFYTDIATFALQRPVKFEYIASSKEEPYDSRRFLVSDEMLIKGRKQYTEALHKLLWWEFAGRPETHEFLGEEVLNG